MNQRLFCGTKNQLWLSTLKRYADEVGGARPSSATPVGQKLDPATHESSSVEARPSSAAPVDQKHHHLALEALQSGTFEAIPLGHSRNFCWTVMELRQERYVYPREGLLFDGEAGTNTSTETQRTLRLRRRGY